MIKCGKCKERHETAAQVRACYGKVNRPDSIALMQARPFGPDRQTLTLEDSRTAALQRESFSHYTKVGGNKQEVREVTRSAVAQANFTKLPDVPAGHYAIEVDGVLKFYKVDKHDGRVTPSSRFRRAMTFGRSRTAMASSASSASSRMTSREL